MKLKAQESIQCLARKELHLMPERRAKPLLVRASEAPLVTKIMAILNCPILVRDRHLKNDFLNYGGEEYAFGIICDFLNSLANWIVCALGSRSNLGSVCDR